MVIRAYLDGIFDIFHYGHLRAFEKIHEFYPEDEVYLIVGVISDLDARSYKRLPVYCEEHRYKLVESCRTVHQIIRNAPLIMTPEFIQEHQIDVVFHGFSNPSDEEKQAEFFKVPRDLGIFQVIPYEKSISTTDIIKTIVDRYMSN